MLSVASELAASLISILGAVLACLLISIHLLYSETKKKMTDFIRRIQFLNGRINEYDVEWYNKEKSQGYLNKIGADIVEGKNVYEPHEYFEEDKFSDFESSRKSLSRIRTLLTEARQKRSRYTGKSRQQLPKGVRSGIPEDDGINSYKSKMLTESEREIKHERLMDFKTSLADSMKDLHNHLNQATSIERNIKRVYVLRRICNYLAGIIGVLLVVGLVGPLLFDTSISAGGLEGKVGRFVTSWLDFHSNAAMLLAAVTPIFIGSVLGSLYVNKYVQLDSSKVKKFRRMARSNYQSIWYRNYYAE